MIQKISLINAIKISVYDSLPFLFGAYIRHTVSNTELNRSSKTFKSTMKSLVFVAALLAVSYSSIIPKQYIITVRNGGPWGTWGPIAMCPENTYAVGFAAKVEPDLVLGDDTALNGIRLYCGNSSISNQLTEIESTTQSFGTWGDRIICYGDGYLTSFSLRVEAAYAKHGQKTEGKAVDDTAANDVMFRCDTGEELKSANGMYWGYWGDWSSECPLGICGLQTKVEAYQGASDDTALNDVQFYCC